MEVVDIVVSECCVNHRGAHRMDRHMGICDLGPADFPELAMLCSSPVSTR